MLKSTLDMKLVLILLMVCFSSIRQVSNSHLDLDDGLDELEESVNYAKQLLAAKELPKNGDLFEGDIVMDDRMRRVVLGVESKRAYLKDRSLWPKGRVPYTFDKSLLPKIKRKILKGMAEFKKYTCIRFVPREDTDTDYVIFKSEPHKCSSSVGRIGGSQAITLGRGCSRLGTVVHEMMHSLDIIHEQSRPDRDSYVTIKLDNVKKKLLHNFQKYDFERASNDGLPYNYGSVMHYSNHAFSKNGKDTIVAKVDPSLRFGQRIQFTTLDIESINRLYNCDKDVTRYADELEDNVTAEDVAVERDMRENSLFGF